MPFMVFCLIGISAGCLGLLLPETLNKPAAETLDELGSPTYQRIVETKVISPSPAGSSSTQPQGTVACLGRQSPESLLSVEALFLFLA